MKSVLRMVSGVAASAAGRRRETAARRAVAEETVRMREAEGSLKEDRMKTALMAVSGWVARRNEQRMKAAEEALQIAWVLREAAEREKTAAGAAGKEAADAAIMSARRIARIWGFWESGSGDRYSAEKKIDGTVLRCTAQTGYGRNECLIHVDGRCVLEKKDGRPVSRYEPGAWEDRLDDKSWPDTYRVRLKCPVCSAKHSVPVPKGQLWIDYYSGGYECLTCSITSPPDTHDGYASASMLRSRMPADAIRDRGMAKAASVPVSPDRPSKEQCGHCGGFCRVMMHIRGCLRCGKPQCCQACCSDML